MLNNIKFEAGSRLHRLMFKFGVIMKFFLFVILVITLLTVDQPQINQVRHYLVNFIGQAAESEYSRGKVSKRIYDELSGKFDTFKPHEEEYVKKITASSQDLITFYDTYCLESEFNGKMSAYNVSVVCTIVAEQFNDLENEVIRTRNKKS